MLGRWRSLGAVNVWRSGHGLWYGSLGISTAAHLAAVAVLAIVWTIPPAGDEPTAVLDGGWLAEEPPLESLAHVALPEMVAPVTITVAGGTRAGDIVPQAAANVQAALESIAPVPITFGAESDTALTDSLAAEVGASPAPGRGSSQGQGDGVGDGTGREFFGISAPGRRFVYVVDCSGSMTAEHPGAAKTRFGRLKLEILKSIGHMQPDQEFFIIYFNHAALPMPADRLQPATPEARQLYLEWMARMVPHGETNPTQAMVLALRLQPDVIYFLTDGSFPKSCIAWLRKLRQNGTAIHTFAFGDPASERLMKDIAAQNRGEYHFIP